MSKDKVNKKTSIGGQALIEGVMMRGPEKTAMAVRHTSGEIILDVWKTQGTDRAKVWKLPFIRGIFNFVDSMKVGYSCLMRSAEMSGMEDEEPQTKQASQPAALAAAADDVSAPDEAAATDEAVIVAAADEQPADKPADKPAKQGFWDKYMWTLIMVLASALGVVIAVGLFMTLPAFLFNLLRQAAPALNNQIWRAVIEGLMRLALFVGYIAAVSLMNDIKRVFMYHGAEHKTIFCYEKGLELTVDNVRRQTRFHPRCGTSFLILMLLVGIIISMFIPNTPPLDNPFLRTGIKLLTIPLIVGIGYELIKLAGRSDHVLVRIISAPGLWLQRVTTKEPTDDMIEVAIRAFQPVVPEDPDADRL